MSIFERALASFGAGAAQVDTLLEFSQYRVGDEVRGVIKVQGGAVKQSVDEIYLFVMSQSLLGGEPQEIAKILLTESFVIQENEQKEIQFAFFLPENTPVTADKTVVWVQTGLDIKRAVDPSDADRITVLPRLFSQDN